MTKAIESTERSSPHQGQTHGGTDSFHLFAIITGDGIHRLQRSSPARITHLFPQSLARESLLDSLLLAGFHIEGMLLRILDDIFLLHLALEAPQCAFKGFAVIQDYFRQALDTSSPNERITYYSAA